jgi:hypothetical protein
LGVALPAARRGRAVRPPRREACDDGPLDGLVDDLFSDQSIMLSAGHEYLVRVNDDPGHPQVVEVIEEITAPVVSDGPSG